MNNGPVKSASPAADESPAGSTYTVPMGATFDTDQPKQEKK